MPTTSGRPGSHADGFRWLRDVISTHPSHTLVDPDGFHLAHVYRTTDSAWRVVDGGMGRVVADGLATAGEGLKVADNEYRPCAYVDTHASHGIVGCDNERELGSIYCAPHARSAKGGD